MKTVLRSTLFLALTIAISQPASAGKFKDFFSKKKDNIAKVFKKKDKQKAPVVKVAKPIEIQPTHVKKVAKAQPIAKAPQVQRAPANVYHGYGRIPRVSLASTWTATSDRLPVMDSERQLSNAKSYHEIAKDGYEKQEAKLHSKKQTSASAPKAKVKAPKSAGVMPKQMKKSGNWFKKVLNKVKKDK